jgi:hypothetical protein
MPNCALPPAAAPTVAVVAAPVTVQQAEEADDVLPNSRSLRNHFYVQFFPRPAAPVEIAPQVAAPVASVPVFQAHCSFLI